MMRGPGQAGSSHGSLAVALASALDTLVWPCDDVAWAARGTALAKGSEGARDWEANADTARLIIRLGE